MLVKELIAFLETQPPDIQVGYALYSEFCLLEMNDISIIKGCAPRPDGWIQRDRPDKETQDYLMFPGN